MNTKAKFTRVYLKDLKPGEPFIFDLYKAVCVRAEPPPGETSDHKLLPWYFVLSNGTMGKPRDPEAMVYRLEGTFNWTFGESE